MSTPAILISLASDARHSANLAIDLLLIISCGREHLPRPISLCPTNLTIIRPSCFIRVHPSNPLQRKCFDVRPLSTIRRWCLPHIRKSSAPKSRSSPSLRMHSIFIDTRTRRLCRRVHPYSKFRSIHASGWGQSCPHHDPDAVQSLCPLRHASTVFIISS
ncbi:hypothetical protein SCHPADRAFT_130772 [Schizopora paradoxa]|uniref:Uncharacterized protein n=1 Tax=Schizopora paradoxa TaxID=27342 RepID=A0A0H2S1U7_9AGAM|nr:hypothetical protein SCHPADRAFT_130772 [Schizopora paradoxa]